MNKYFDKINSLADKFVIKLGQAKSNANIEYVMQSALVDLINSNFNTIKKPDIIIIEVVALSEYNSIVLHFKFGKSDLTRVNSDTAANIEEKYIAILKANPKMKIIFDKKMFTPFKVIVDTNLLKLVSVQPGATKRNIKETL